MPALPNALIGVFLGVLATEARIDAMWWPHFGQVGLPATPLAVSHLKSKIPLPMRSDAEAYYRAAHASSFAGYNYIVVSMAVLVALTLIGGWIQHPHRRLRNAICLVLWAAAAALHTLGTNPIIADLVTTKTRHSPSRPKGVSSTDIQITSLYNIAAYHALTAVCVAIVLMVQVAADESEEEEAAEARKAVARASRTRMAAAAATTTSTPTSPTKATTATTETPTTTSRSKK